MATVRDCRRCGNRFGAGSSSQYFCSLSCRFWSKVSKSGPEARDGLGPCWTWTAGRFVFGYGIVQTSNPRRTTTAHRVSYELAHGPIPAGMAVCHRCDNPPCVNPDHLFLGTQAENLRDMYAKGRGSKQCGEEASAAKLTEDDVREIRRAHAAKEDTMVAIGARFGVTGMAVSGIVRRKNWRHVA